MGPRTRVNPVMKALLFASLLALAACGGGGGSPSSTDFNETPAAVLTTSTYQVALHCAPEQEPSRGVNSLELLVTRTSDGTAVDGLDVSVVPFMPAMGHGGSVKPTVTAGHAPGVYRVTNVNLFMPGLWELRTTIATEHATAQFDIP